MNNKCFVCDGDIDKSSDDVTSVTEKGISILVKTSNERKDRKSSQLMGLTSLLIHKSCRKNYTRSDSIAAYLKRQAASTSSQPVETVSLRSSLSQFHFMTDCFICAKPCDIDKEAKKKLQKRRTIYQVRTMGIQQKCLDAGLARKDKWGEDVVDRLSSINDLVAEEAVYHQDCYRTFTRHLYMEKKEPKTDDYILKGMEEIYSYMEGNQDCQFSMNELMAAVTGNQLDWRTIKAKLHETYGDRVLFKPGTNRFNIPVICFRDIGYKLLNDAWYHTREKNNADERMRIVRSAADIIRQDIQSHIYDSDMYPPGDDLINDADCLPQPFSRSYRR